MHGYNIDMKDNELQWDRLLKIKTSGRDDTGSDEYRYPYEPTPYCVLEKLAQSGYIGKKNTLLDYGTGKGRVCFFMSYQTRCRSIGVEYNQRIYESARKNKDSSISGRLTDIVKASAESYKVPEDVDVCYFFNPFSVDIFRKTLARIIESCDENPRQVLLVFYYIQDEYRTYLMTHSRVEYVDDIDFRNMFDGDNIREHIMIFRVS